MLPSPRALLLILLALPLASAVAVALLGALGPKIRAIRWLSLLTTVVTLALAAYLTLGYTSLPHVHAPLPSATDAKPDFQPHYVTVWQILSLPGSSGIQFYVGLDGLNVWLVLLTCVLMVPAVLISWNSIQERIPEYYAWLLVLQTAMLGVFLAFDIVLFYVFFELTLVPLFFLIGIWGGSQRQYAARKFFIYTLAGSVFTLLGVLGLALTLASEGPDRKLTFSIPELVQQVDRYSKDLQNRVDQARQEPAVEGEAVNPRLTDAEKALSHWRRVQFWVFVAMLCGFAIKVPLVPVHTWLPLAHVEAPTAGSVLLAGVLLKVGSYGFLRLCLPLAPEASISLGAPLIGTLSVVGIIYGAFCALSQHDIKRLVAYSSVSHMGFCMLGMFSTTEVGLTGSVLQMINHGLSTGALFLLVGMLYDRYHTRKISDYSGMASRLRLLAAFFVVITMSSIGLPGLNGFVGEFLVLMGTFGSPLTLVDGRLLAALACSGVVLGAWYMLTLVMKVFFGPLREPGHGDHHVSDLVGREYLAIVPIVLLCIVLGVYPNPVVDTMKPELRTVTGIVERARTRLQAPEDRLAAGGAAQPAETETPIVRGQVPDRSGELRP